MVFLKNEKIIPHMPNIYIFRTCEPKWSYIGIYAPNAHRSIAVRASIGEGVLSVF